MYHNFPVKTKTLRALIACTTSPKEPHAHKGTDRIHLARINGQMVLYALQNLGCIGVVIAPTADGWSPNLADVDRKKLGEMTSAEKEEDLGAAWGNAPRKEDFLAGAKEKRLILSIPCGKGSAISEAMKEGKGAVELRLPASDEPDPLAVGVRPARWSDNYHKFEAGFGQQRALGEDGDKISPAPWLYFEEHSDEPLEHALAAGITALHMQCAATVTPANERYPYPVNFGSISPEDPAKSSPKVTWEMRSDRKGLLMFGLIMPIA